MTEARTCGFARILIWRRNLSSNITCMPPYRGRRSGDLLDSDINQEVNLVVCVIVIILSISGVKYVHEHGAVKTLRCNLARQTHGCPSLNADFLTFVVFHLVHADGVFLPFLRQICHCSPPGSPPHPCPGMFPANPQTC